MTTASPMRIMDTTLLCSNFPENLHDEIFRENLLYALEQMFSGDTEIGIVCGTEGIGKTTLLAQFGRTRSEYTASIFLRGSNRFGYEPGHILLDLSNQLGWLAGKKDEQLDRFDESVLSRHVYELQRKATRQNRKFFILVDGIDDIPQEDAIVRETILSALPLMPQFRIILSAKKNHLGYSRLAKMRQSSLPLSPFALYEARAYMGNTVEPGLLEELYRVTKGIPGDLASYKRMLSSGISQEELLKHLPHTLTDKYELEWRVVDSANELQAKILAFIAHGDVAHTLADIALFLCTTVDQINNTLSSLNFIEFGSGGEVQFVSETFRRFAAGKLTKWKPLINDLIIQAFTAESNSLRSMYRLPQYLQETEQYDKLLQYLSPEHFNRALDQIQSLSPLRHQADLGLETALELKRDGDLLRFSAQQAATFELDAFRISDAQIDAYVDIGDDAAALALASSAVLKEDKLRLLTTLCTAKVRNSQSPEEEIIDQIKSLLNEVDIRDLGEKAISLAGDLICFLPDKAINVVERMSKTKAGQSVDLTLMSLSLSAAMRQKSIGQSQGIASIFKQLNDPGLRDVFSVLSTAFASRKYSAKEVLAEAHKLRRSEDQIFLLRQWTKTVGRNDSEAGEVVKHVMNLIVKTSEYTPTATHLRQVALALRHLPAAELNDLIGMFDAQKHNTERHGPTEDYIWLQLIIAETESTFSHERAIDRILEVYLYVIDQADLFVKAICLSRLLCSLVVVDPAQQLERTDRLHSIVRTEMELTVEQLLAHTADHFEVMENILDALAHVLPEDAVRMAGLLNTEDRRDQAFAAIIDGQLEMPLSTIDFTTIETCLDRITCTIDKEEKLVDIVSTLASDASVESDTTIFDRVSPILGRIILMQDPILRARTLAHGIAFLKKNRINAGMQMSEHFEKALVPTSEAIDDDLLRVETEFELGSILAVYDRPLAVKCVALAHEESRQLANVEAGTSFVCCLRLAIRTFAGLMADGIDREDDLLKLDQLIQRVPSERRRARLWSQIVLECFAVGKVMFARRIVNDKLRPIITKLETQNKAEWEATVAACASCLYLSQPTIGIELIDMLSKPLRDEAYDDVITFILRKVPSSDPYDSYKERYRISYDEAIDICTLLKKIDHDWTIYSNIKVIVESLLWKENKLNFTAEQRSDINRRLEDIVNCRLPSPRFIRHSGFKIAAMAQLGRLSKHDKRYVALLEEARKIQNIADRSVVLSMIAEAGSQMEPSERRSVFEEAKKLNESTGFLLDKIDGLCRIADRCSEFDQTFSRQCLKEAFDLVKWRPDRHAASMCRTIINAAHALSEEWAAALVGSMDDDSARQNARQFSGEATSKRMAKQLAQQRVNELKLREELTKEAGIPSDLSEVPTDEIADVFWESIGGLNSGRREPVSINRSRCYLKIAAAMPMQFAYPVISWAIENAKRKLKGTTQVSTIIRGMFEAATSTAELITKMVAIRRAGATRSLQPLALNIASSVVKAGERHKALEEIERWLSEDVSEYLKISDPFIGPVEASQILRMVLASAPDATVSILTSKKHQPKNTAQSLEDQYSSEWRKICDQEPPDCQITVAGLRSSGEPPVHDRWWITSRGGLRLGTSFNSIGDKKDSEIVRLTLQEAADREQQLNMYLYGLARERQGERITYTTFTLER